MRKNYFNKLDNLKIKYKKDPKEFILLLSSIVFVLFLSIGSSYAYLTYIGKTQHTTTINAGTLALDIRNEANTIKLEKAVPQEDYDAIERNKAYNFTVKNTGTIKETYEIKLENTCTIGKTYTINGENKNVDMCIPNEYIRVGVKEGNGTYKVIKSNEEGNLILTVGSLNKNEEKNYSIKIWLSWEMPNVYNNQNDENVTYTAKLNIDYNQGEKDLETEGYKVIYNSNGGQGAMEVQTFSKDESKRLSKNTFTKENATFLGWTTNKNSDEIEYENEQEVSNLSDVDNDKVILYAVWSTSKYTIVFNANGGEGGQTESITATYGKVLPTITSEEPTREGYTFMGWYDNVDYTKGEKYYDKDGKTGKILNEDGLTLYAGWKPPLNYIVNVTVINGTIDGDAQKNVIHGEDVTFNLNPLIGYGDGATVSCSNGQSAIISSEGEEDVLTVKRLSSNTTCTITYNIYTYNVTFDSNDPTGTTTTGMPENQIKTYGSPLTLTSERPVNTDYEFIGWSTTKNATEESIWYDPSITYNVNSKATLYAQWFNVKNLEENITGSVHAGDLQLTNVAVLSNTAVSSWSYSNTPLTNIAIDSGYEQVGKGLPYWLSLNRWFNVYRAYEDGLFYRNSYTSSLTTEKRGALLEVKQRTGTTNVHETLDNRILALQNESEGCLSYLPEDEDLKIKYTSQTISLEASGVNNTVIEPDEGYTSIMLAGYDLDGSGISYMNFYNIYKQTVYIHNRKATAYTPTLFLRLLETRNKEVGTAIIPSYDDYSTKGQKYYKALMDLQTTEKTKLFKYTDCGSDSVLLPQPESSSQRSAEFTTTHSRIVAPTGFSFINGSSGTGESYASILALKMLNDTTGYIQVVGLYRTSNTTSYTMTNVDATLYAFVIDKH